MLVFHSFPGVFACHVGISLATANQQFLFLQGRIFVYMPAWVGSIIVVVAAVLSDCV